MMITDPSLQKILVYKAIEFGALNVVKAAIWTPQSLTRFAVVDLLVQIDAGAGQVQIYDNDVTIPSQLLFRQTWDTAVSHAGRFFEPWQIPYIGVAQDNVLYYDKSAGITAGRILIRGYEI